MSDTPMYKKLSRVINGALVGALTAVVLLMAVVILPGLIGFKSVVVLSGSMEPALHVGDVAVLRPVDSDRLKVGDVITYRSAGHLTTHRIIRIEEGQSGLAFYTKGDANETADGAPVHGDNWRPTIAATPRSRMPSETSSTASASTISPRAPSPPTAHGWPSRCWPITWPAGPRASVWTRGW